MNEIQVDSVKIDVDTLVVMFNTEFIKDVSSGKPVLRARYTYVIRDSVHVFARGETYALQATNEAVRAVFRWLREDSRVKEEHKETLKQMELGI